MERIELVVFDIDGVITDGSVIVDSRGTEQKRVNFKDMDAIFELYNRGFKLAAITGEDTPIVDYFEKRFPWEYFYRGGKTKKDAMLQIEEGTGISAEHICYVGDGKYDVEPLKHARLGICPADAIDAAKMSSQMVLQKKGGDGCVWELLSILENFNNEFSPQKYVYNRLEEHVNIFKTIATDQELMNEVIRIGDRIIKIFNAGGGIFLCGNGGSAADAQHIATEFVSRFYKDRPGLNTEALSVNTSTITAIGNDYSFERIFARQLEAKAKSGDMVIGITTSGRSRNILEAFRYAKDNGIVTVLLTGGHNLDDVDIQADYTISIPAKITPRVQETHIFVGHVIAEYVEWKMFGRDK
ncbi:MAG: SIS domain-containing protein [Lachnospiraceae bacterium]|nr:SIS domain-containing protein [Lachnospiraceae bacterium]